MVKIHEMEYEINNPINMQYRNKMYESWESYCENLNLNEMQELEMNDHILSCNFKMVRFPEILFHHHAYIVED